MNHSNRSYRICANCFDLQFDLTNNWKRRNLARQSHEPDVQFEVIRTRLIILSSTSSEAPTENTLLLLPRLTPIIWNAVSTTAGKKFLFCYSRL